MKGYGGVLLSLLALWPIRQLFVQTILLRGPPHARGGALDVAIAERRSAGMAALAAATYVATALAISQLA
jgi:D-alanyl-D-alanine dipeptidase